MKAVMLSIQPKWCELIASGKKTVEVRKTAPKLQTPFKCYIYCTKDAKKHYYIDEYGDRKVELIPTKIICEFVCDKMEQIVPDYNPVLQKFFYGYVTDLSPTCLSEEDLHKYAGIEPLYFWHISDLKIYDTPKELGEFFTRGECEREFCGGCRNFHRGEGWLDGSYCDEDSCIEWGIKPLTRPPQSWCYVEEL